MHCALGAVVVVGGTREPQTARAEEDDGIHATVLRALDAAFNLYGIHYQRAGNTAILTVGLGEY